MPNQLLEDQERFEAEMINSFKEAGWKYIMIDGHIMLIDDWFDSARWKIYLEEVRQNAETDS